MKQSIGIFTPEGSYGVIYKRCCSGSNPTACTLAPASLQDGIDPNEGTCPDGTYETPPGTTSCPAGAAPPPPPSNYCTDAGYHACTPGEAVGSCTLNGQSCTSYSHYACNFSGQDYCDNNSTCDNPCSAPGQPPPTPTSIFY